MRVVLSYIMKFIQSISFFLLSLSLILIFTVFNEDYVLDLLNNHNYYRELYDNTLEEVSYYLEQSGLNEEVLNNVISVKSLKKEIITTIDNLYTNQKITVNTEEFQNNLTTNINNYIKDTQYKERLNRMRTISEETGIVLENGILDIKEKEFTDEQLNILVKYLKPIESKIPFRFYILPNELQEILKEAILDEEHIIYVLIRKICEVDNKVYLIRMNKAKEIKEKVKNVINKKGDITFKTRTNTEYKATRKTRRGITREKLFEKCLLIQDFVNDEYLTFNELFGICTNLSCIEGGLKFFKEVIKNSKHNIARSTDWYAFKAEQIYSQLLLPTRCNNFCEYKYICKHGKNIIQTVKTQRKELVQIGIYDLISLGEAMKKYNEILKELFINE